MDIKEHSILVTGGASGIGLALASRFLAAGNKVLICGRREDVLNKARGKFPGLRTHRCDLREATERRALVEWTLHEMPDLDVLVNNAGVQRRVNLTSDPEWEDNHDEIRINLEAPIHLTTLLIPQLRTRAKPAIINVTSGLAFVPLAAVPLYSATKAAMHSFTLSLRYQLRDYSPRHCRPTRTWTPPTPSSCWPAPRSRHRRRG